jgi:hypothetical protein
MGWLLTAGIPADRIAQAVGLRIPGKAGGVGGRIPDMIVWSKTQTEGRASGEPLIRPGSRTRSVFNQ